MPEISITDNLGSPVAGLKVDLSQPSSLVNYARSAVLHLLVAPDFVERKDQSLTQAAPTPLRFQAKLGNLFDLGLEQPEITLTPRVNAVLRVNASAGTNFFDEDAFPVNASVPEGVALVGLGLSGSLDGSASGTAGNLSFGLDAGGGIAIESIKAFPTGAGQPALGAATAQMLSAYLIPASVADLKRMQLNDVCTVTGKGSLTVNGGFDLSVPINPLASVNLPLNAGSVDVKAGVMTGVSASFGLSGHYQIRVRRLGTGAVELSYLRDRGTRWQTDFSASAGLVAKLNRTELMAALMGAIARGGSDPKLFEGLTDAEVQTFEAAVQEGVSHSIQASVDAALSLETDNQAAFQYELDLDALDDASTAAVNRALRGDLTALTDWESRGAAGQKIAPGVKLLDSLLVRSRTHGATLKVNLLGIVNLLSLSRLISSCEILFEPASGDLTIKETAQSERIGAITDLLRRQEALRKALFESVLVTTTYRAAQAIAAPELDCHCLHFVLSRSTTPDNVRDYLNWFVALGLIKQAELPALLAKYQGDASSACVLRAAFNDAACGQLFFDAGGKLREESYYLNYGRQALRAMLAPSTEVVDRVRYRVLDEDTRWTSAIDTGPSPALRQLIPLDRGDAHFDLALALVTGDLYDLVWWAHGMTAAGKTLQAMRQFLAGRTAGGALEKDPEFLRRRDALQKAMLKMVAESKARFDLPWGMAALYWSAGSTGGVSGRASAGNWVIARP